MHDLLPAPFLFRFAFPLRKLAEVPRKAKLPAQYALSHVANLDAAGARKPWVVHGAWNENWLAFSVEVRGKSRPVQGSSGNPTWADGLQVWIDTRNTQGVHRATRFCHHFCLPAGGDGQAAPAAVQLPIARAKDDAPMRSTGEIRLDVQTVAGGYNLLAVLPASALHGYDPQESPRLGWYYRIRDAELGDQYLTVSPELPFSTDPSLWSTLELVSE